MNLTRLTACAIMALSFFAVPLGAESLKDVQAPAEFPPSSYAGKQYVDSRGCVFIRAGIGGTTTWVPRVTRSRQLICGQKPTFDQPQVAVAPRPAPSRVRELTLDQPPQTQAPAPTPRRTVQTPQRAPVVQAPQDTPSSVATTTQRVPAPVTANRTRPDVPVSPATPQTAEVDVARAQPQTAEGEPLSGRVVTIRPRRSDGTLGEPRRAVIVRPAPDRVAEAPRSVNVEAVPPTPRVASVSRAATPALPAPVRRVGGPETYVAERPSPAPKAREIAKTNTPPSAPTRRAVRGQVVKADAPLPASTRVVPRHVYENRQNTQNVSVPRGYARVWDDDRLNPKRAEQTLAGIASTKMVWTNTVPRRLVPASELKTSNFVRQKQKAQPARAKQKAKAPAVRAKTAPVAQPKRLKRSRYVQIGVYRSEQSAKRAAARLQSAGLVVRMSAVKRNGGVYRTVVTGPYAKRSQLNRALQVARAQGFSKARLR